MVGSDDTLRKMTKPETAPVSDSTREKYKHVRFADVDLSVANDQCDACSCGCVGWLFNIFSMVVRLWLLFRVVSLFVSFLLFQYF